MMLFYVLIQQQQKKKNISNKYFRKIYYRKCCIVSVTIRYIDFSFNSFRQHQTQFSLFLNTKENWKKIVILMTFMCVTMMTTSYSYILGCGMNLYIATIIHICIFPRIFLYIKYYICMYVKQNICFNFPKLLTFDVPMLILFLAISIRKKILREHFLRKRISFSLFAFTVVLS